MPIRLADLIAYLGADTSGLDRSLDEAEGKSRSWVANLGGSITTLLGGAVVAGVAAVTGAVLGIGAAAFSAGQTMDEAFDTILINTGATGDELEQLKQDFRDVFGSLPVAAGPTADVISVLNQRLGLTGDALTTLARPLLEVSRILGTDARLNTELYTRVMGDWNIANDEAAGTLDELFVVSQNTGIGLDRLMEQVVQFGSPLRLMGFDLQESAALFGKWEQEGVNAELVMGSLRIAAGEFARENIPLRDGLFQTMEAIRGAADESAALAIGMDVFGARAGPDMVAAILEGRFAIEDIIAAMQDADGTIMTTAAATSDFGEKWVEFQNKATLALEPLGMLLMDVAGTVLDVLGPVLTDLAARAMPYVQQAAQQLADNMPAIIEWVTNAFRNVRDFIVNELWPRLQAFATWFANEGWPAIQQVIGDLRDGFDTVRTFVVDTLVPALETAFENVKTGVQKAWKWIQTNIVPAIEGAFNSVSEFFATFSSGLAGDWTDFGQMLMDAWLNVNIGLRDISNRIGEAIRGVITTAWDAIIHTDWLALGRSIIDGIAQGLYQFGYRIGEAVRSAADGALNSVRTFLGIQSPSTVFAAQVGQPMGEGIAQGIGDAVGAINSALRGAIQMPDVAGLQMAGAAVGAAGGAGTTIHGGLHVTFQGNAPTTEAEAEDSARLFITALREKGMQV